MFESIKSFFDIIYDRSRSIGHRTAVFFSTVGFLIIVDLCFNFTYDIHISNKLSNLKTISELKEIYKNDSVVVEKLRKTEMRLLSSGHYSELIPFYYSGYNPKFSETIEIKTTQSIQNKPIQLNRKDSLQIKRILELSSVNKHEKDFSSYMLFFDSLRTSQQKVIEKTETKIIKQPIQAVDSKERSRMLMFISSNFIFLLIFIFLIFVPFFNKDQKLGTLIFAIFAMEVMLAIIMIVVYWTAYWIPVIFHNPWWNYMLNFAINLLFIIGLTKLTKKASKKSV